MNITADRIGRGISDYILLIGKIKFLTWFIRLWVSKVRVGLLVPLIMTAYTRKVI